MAGKTCCRRDLSVALVVFLLGVLVRVPLLSQSLWCDELFSLNEYVYVPVKQIVAGKPGIQYYPNNHALHSLLAKFTLSTAKALHVIPRARPTDNPPPSRPIGTGSGSFSEAVYRIPSLLAGSAVGIVLAWPLRRRQPGAALLIAGMLAIQPWMVGFSTAARGYSLLLLLAGLATHLLPDRPRRVAWGYTVTIVLGLYTVPIFAMVVMAHGAVMLLMRRRFFGTWLASAAVGGVVAAALYSPLYGVMHAYYKVEHEPTISYMQFLRQLPVQAITGQKDSGLPPWLPVAVMVVGGYLAWKREMLRPAVLTFAVASVLGVIAPLASRAAGEVRFVPWLMLLYVIALAGIVMELWQRRGLWVGAVALVALFVVHAGVQYVHMYRVPCQPIREGMDRIGKIAPRDAHVILVNMGAHESAFAYGDMAPQWVECAYTVEDLQDRERAGTGPVWAVISFERIVRREGTEVWDYLQAHYTLRDSLPGRIAPFDIYERTH